MDQVASELIPIVRFLSTAGAGILASWLFASLRRSLPMPQARPAALPARLGLALLYTPRWSRLTVLALAAAFALLFGALLAFLEGRPVVPVVDAALAALISQIWHAVTDLSAEAPPAQGEGIYSSLQRRLDQGYTYPVDQPKDGQ